MRPFTLSRDTFHILVAQAGCDRHGYSISKSWKNGPTPRMTTSGGAIAG
jgi:hypothetical protein